jgi:hypothetical protein
VLSYLIVASTQVDAVALVVFAAGAIGFINGFILYGGPVIAGTIVPIQERGKLMSLVYTFAYAGTVPTVTLGYLGDAIGSPPACRSSRWRPRRWPCSSCWWGRATSGGWCPTSNRWSSPPERPSSGDGRPPTCSAGA